MKMNKTSFDASKKKFYENLKARKDEIESEIEAAKDSPNFCEFDNWEKINNEYRFLKDMLGPIYYQGVPQFDYNGLLNLPKFKWTESDGTEHIHALIGTHTPGYYGFLAATNLMSANDTIQINVIEPNSDCGKEDERKISIQANTEKLQTVLKDEPGYSKDKYLKVIEKSDGTLGYKWTDIAAPIVENVIQWDNATKELFKGEPGAYVIVDDIKLGDKTVLNRISDEASTRATADTTLQSNIDSEASTRQAADTTLTNNLNTEIATRENADNVLDTKIDTKITLLGNEEYSGEPYHFPFNFDAKLEDNKIKVHLDTITLDNNKTRVSYDKELALPELGKVDDVKVDGVSVVTDKIANIDLTNKMDLLGSVPGHTDLPYNLPYFFETSADGEKVTVTAKTISLDNKKTQGSYSLDVLSATTTTAGLMSAEDKTKLGDAQSKVKYSETEPVGSKDGDIWMF